MMRKTFVFARATRPDGAWRDRFLAGRAEAARWCRGQGRGAALSAADCRRALAAHMPELLAEYDRVCGLVGGDEDACRILSHYRPPPVASGCSQAVWLGKDGPALVRNYDYALEIVTGRIESTSWFGNEVIATVQRPWGGCLDGMNREGLVASLTYGGHAAAGRGFAVILILRYVLETCRSVEQAVAALCRIPIAMAHNVTVLDRTGAHATLFLGPDRAPLVTDRRACANHQDRAGSATESEAREGAMLAALDDPAMTLDGLVGRFLLPPLYSRRRRSTTAYTAVYRPAHGYVDYLWPSARRRQRLGAFAPTRYAHDYGDLTDDAAG